MVFPDAGREVRECIQIRNTIFYQCVVFYLKNRYFEKACNNDNKPELR